MHVSTSTYIFVADMSLHIHINGYYHVRVLGTLTRHKIEWKMSQHRNFSHNAAIACVLVARCGRMDMYMCARMHQVAPNTTDAKVMKAVTTGFEQHLKLDWQKNRYSRVCCYHKSVLGLLLLLVLIQVFIVCYL